MTTAPPVLPVGLDTFSPHPWHAPTQIWAETNCSLDVWIELLNAQGLDPAPAGACALSADFRSDQWQFLKIPLEDLRSLYGITVEELTLWRPLLDHLADQTAAGRLLTIEVDSFYLPDTVGIAYRTTHTKSTIVPNVVDRAGRRMEYFHNSGYWELDGEDFDGVFRLGEPEGSPMLDPYVELVALDGVDAGRDLLDAALVLAREHLARRPAVNPVTRLAARITGDVGWLAEHDLGTFHRYAFAMVRQCGATAEIASGFLRWLAGRGQPGLDDAAESFATVARDAKSLQFQLARAARGRGRGLDDTLQAMTAAWDAAMTAVVTALVSDG